MNYPCCGEVRLSDTERCPACGCAWREPLVVPTPGHEIAAELRRIRELLERVAPPPVMHGRLDRD